MNFRALYSFLVTVIVVMNASADEGMWLLNDPPRATLKAKYDFELTDAWLEHARLASVRFNNGGSGGFVSRNGLVVTNHHIGAGAIQRLSNAERDLYRNGFYAPTRDAELKCPALELNVLQSIEDVTARVQAVVKSGMTPQDAAAARRKVMNEIEKESQDRTGLRSDVVTLYHGGLYHLYRYKKYTDVRLVFAPEHAIAAFGGDTDNFEFPRHDLDVCFLRVYENDQPASIEHYFRWSTRGPNDGDLVFVTGHPGTTNRLETFEKLVHRRDHSHPYALARLRAMEAALLQYSERSPEHARQAASDLQRVANARKAYAGQFQGLLDPKVLARKSDEQQKLIALSATEGSSGSPWKAVAQAQTGLVEFERPWQLLERGDALAGELFNIARQLVRLADESVKPNGERLREYRESNLESLKLQLFSPAPIYPGLEQAELTASLTFLAEMLGGRDPRVKQVLGGKPPAARAAELVAGSKLADVAERKRLAEGGKDAIASSSDAMIVLALALDDDARQLRKRYEDEVEEVERQAYARIGQVRFRAFGKEVAPDATFTLRLAFGVVKGYQEDGAIPYCTTLGGAFALADRHLQREPFALPARWRDGKAQLDLGTPLNFVSTADTIGGNSGSPVLNRAGELVGLNFDRNRHGLVRNFVYTDEQARHIAVHSRAILAALRTLYRCNALVAELGEPGS